ncbi:hypothetical protein Aduo_016070 [Ancylostoma duodenale]
MAPKQALEAVDKLLQYIMQTRVIFGDKIMVLGGDFRQILQTIPSQEKHERSTSAEEWKNYLLNVGDGKVQTNNDEEIVVPEKLRCRESLINEIFGPFLNRSSRRRKRRRDVNCAPMSSHETAQFSMEL